MKTQDLRQKLFRKNGKRRSSKTIERLLRRYLPLLEQLEDRLAPAGILQTDIPLVIGTNYQSSVYTAALIAAVHFEDISKNPAAIAVLSNTDNSVVEASIGFNFNFYGNSYNKIFVSSNGLLSFKSQPTDTGYADEFNTDLTANLGPNRPLIAALWDDWLSNVSSADQVYVATLGTPGNRRLVIQWDQLTGYANSPTTVTFEAALFENDGRIEFRYKDVIAGDGFQDYFRDNGQEATIGIRSGYPQTLAGVPYASGSGDFPKGVDAIQIGFNTGAVQQPLVRDGMTIAFVPGNVALANFPPDVSITGTPEVSPEGTQIDLGSVVSDPDKTGGERATFTYDWSVTRNGVPVTTGFQTTTNGPSFSFTPANNGNYVVQLIVVDQGGATTTTRRAISVTNVAPVLDLGSTASVASSGTTFLRTIHFIDPGDDTWTVEFDYGNGVKRSFALIPGQQGFDPATHTFQMNYAFPTDTTYKVSVRITDNDDGTDTEDFPVTVFDPNEFARIVAFAIGEVGADGTGAVNLPAGGFVLAAILAGGHEGDNVALTLFNSDPTSDQNQITVPGTIPVRSGTGISNVQPLVFIDTRAITDPNAIVTQTYEFVLPDALATNNIQLYWFDKVLNRWQLVKSEPGNGDTVEITPILDAAGQRTGNSRVRLTKTFGPGSFPATDHLTGTVFSIAVPVGGSGSTATFVVLPTTLVSNAPGIGSGVVVQTTDLGSRSNFALSLQETQTPLPAAGATIDETGGVDQILNWLLNGELRRRGPGLEPSEEPAEPRPTQQPPTPQLPGIGGAGGGEQAIDGNALADLFASEVPLEATIQPFDITPPTLAADDTVSNEERPTRQVDPRRLHAGIALASLLAGAAGLARPRPRNGKRYKPTLQTSGTP